MEVGKEKVGFTQIPLLTKLNSFSQRAVCIAFPHAKHRPLKIFAIFQIHLRHSYSILFMLRVCRRLRKQTQSLRQPESKASRNCLPNK